MDDAGVLHKGQGGGSISRVGFYGPSAVSIYVCVCVRACVPKFYIEFTA